MQLKIFLKRVDVTINFLTVVSEPFKINCILKNFRNTVLSENVPYSNRAPLVLTFFCKKSDFFLIYNFLTKIIPLLEAII